MGVDFLLYTIIAIIDAKYRIDSSGGFFMLNFCIFAPIVIITVVLLFLKKKMFCKIGGFFYLVGGGCVWLYKIIYFTYLILGDGLNYYEPEYSNATYILIFIINLLSIGLRLLAAYFIKKLYPDIITWENIIKAKEQAEFVKSLGNSGDNKISEDEEITEDKLAQSKNNPFLTGRKKEDDNEEEEYNV